MNWIYNAFFNMSSFFFKFNCQCIACPAGLLGSTFPPFRLHGKVLIVWVRVVKDAAAESFVVLCEAFI